ncbi:MAG TPA: DinB family protein [Rhodothermales bacterium]|nr:DinB family protein [Rhodothermales bacterium]
MTFDLAEARAVLARTPGALDAWLRGLPEAWIVTNEGPETWSAFDVVGHLIHADQTTWMPRVQTLLDHGEGRPFGAFNRYAQERENVGKTLDELLDTFAALRRESLAALDALALTPDDLARRGTHPAFGTVTLGELLAAWVVHDLGHMTQIARVMAKRYSADVGPWAAYLSILDDRPRPSS